jgi:putative endonuclease
MPQWFVYLLRCRDDSLYCGITTALARRVAEHNCGKGAKYVVPSRRPVACVWKRRAGGASEALRLEAWIKRRPVAIKRDLAEGRIALRRRKDGGWGIIRKA